MYPNEKEESVMARDIILDMCDALKAVAASSDIEEMCRYEVAQEMEYQDRILDDAEIEDIVNDVVVDEAVVDPIDSINDGVVEMTDIEWGNVSDDYKVIDTDGDESAIIEGSIYKVSLRKDDRVERIASKISREIESAWQLRNASTGIACDKESYMKPIEAAELDVACPDCGSYNQTLVWYDGDFRYWHCNVCDTEYKVPTDGGCEPMSIEEITTEDITIYEDDTQSVFGSLFYDGELGWTYQVWHNGECIAQDLVDDAGDAYGIFNSIKSEYDSLSVGATLKSASTGDEITISEIDGDSLHCGYSVVSKAAMACDIALGRVLVDNSDVYAFKIAAGDCYRNLVGEEIEVVTANGQEVLYMASEMDPYTHDYRTSYRTANRNKFVDYLVDKGYLA